MLKGIFIWVVTWRKCTKREYKPISLPFTESLLTNNFSGVFLPGMLIHGTDNKETFSSQELCSHEETLKSETRGCQLSELEAQRPTEAL